MYLIQALMTGKLSTVPNSLPQHVYDEAGRRSPKPVSPPSNPSLPPAPPTHPSRSTPPVVPLLSAESLARQSSISPFADPPPRHPSSRITSMHVSQPTSPGWEISPATKVQADHVFSTLDTRNKGRVKGEAVRQYIHQSGLSSSATGRIWCVIHTTSIAKIVMRRCSQGFGRYRAQGVPHARRVHPGYASHQNEEGRTAPTALSSPRSPPRSTRRRS